MHQPEDEEEKKKIEEILKKQNFSIDINNMQGLNDMIKDMLYGPQTDDTLYKELNKLTDAIFAAWGENPLPSTDSIIFIGKNIYGEQVFKQKHFIVDGLYISYLNHIRSHAAHTLQQPEYYKNLHEILN